MRQAAEIAFGVGNHLLFALTVWRLFWFLKGADTPALAGGSLCVNIGLALLFVVPHSAMPLPAVRKRLSGARRQIR